MKKWATFNEPLVHIECGYYGDAHWPQVRDFKRAIQVGYHTLLAHAKAVAEFRKLALPDGEICIILNLSPVYPKSQEAADREAAEWADLLYIRSFLDCVVYGQFPEKLTSLFKEHQLTPEYEAADAEIFRENTVDFIGCNYYQPLRIQAPLPQNAASHPFEPRQLFRGYDWPEKKINPHRGWEIYPEGIYDIAMRLKNDYQNMPWFISENGMGVSEEERFMDATGQVNDTYRITFVEDHLRQLHRAIEDGSPCFGYHMWTFMDCWSWLNAYKNRYGFYRVDLKNNFERYPKASSFWLAEVAAKNAID